MNPSFTGRLPFLPGWAAPPSLLAGSGPPPSVAVLVPSEEHAPRPASASPRDVPPAARRNPRLSMCRDRTEGGWSGGFRWITPGRHASHAPTTAVRVDLTTPSGTGEIGDASSKSRSHANPNG